MKKQHKDTQNITDAIKSVDDRMKRAISPKEHEVLEQKMADLMEKLLCQLRPKQESQEGKEQKN